MSQIIPFVPRPRRNSPPAGSHSIKREIWALVGDFSIFPLLYTKEGMCDAPAYLAANLFEALCSHSSEEVRGASLVIWADAMPLDARRWMFYATAECLPDALISVLTAVSCPANGWHPVGRIPSLPMSAVPFYQYDNGNKFVLMSDTVTGGSSESVAHPFIIQTGEGLHMGFGTFPADYEEGQELFLVSGNGGGFRSKSARELNPGAKFRLEEQ